MKTRARKFVHMGINYVVLPTVSIDQRKSLQFQEALLSAGIDFTSVALQDQQIRVQRKPPLPLEIRVIVQAAKPKSLAQVLILGPAPYNALNNFASEVEAVLQAFEQTWPAPHRQIVSSDVTLRCLYPSTSEHAFQEIWEGRLGQSPAALTALGRPVLGGGLRFVMPPQAGDPQPTQIEVKIESFFQDAQKIFVETQFLWPGSRPIGTPFEPAAKLQQANAYILEHVHAFLSGQATG